MPRNAPSFQPLIAGALLVVSLGSCAVSPETQAKIDEYNRTIPSCSSTLECQTMWATARTWTLRNSDFPIYSESENRIRATSTLTTSAGTGVVVHRESQNGGYRFTVEIECFTAFGCPEEWDLKLDFNRVVAAAGN